jgi:SAM-dependent methyltransferase
MEKIRLESLLERVAKRELLAAVMSSPWKKEPDQIAKVNIRPLEIKGQLRYQVSCHYRQKVTHQNLVPADCAEYIKNSFNEKFRQGTLVFKEESYHILVNKRKHISIVKKAIEKKELPLTHNVSKKYILEEGTVVSFLVELGIMAKTGAVIAKKHDKFRQINRFLEMVRDVIEYLPKERCIEIVDFGCGKAYLTFALYHYLSHVEGRKVHIVGLDLKKEVIEMCQQLADNLDYKDLEFAVGDINNHNPQEKVDLVISLHACDTATDAAIEKGIRWGAEVLLCVPCCQHELYNQITSEPLNALLKHGILRERFVALATDAARADLLTALGYDVQVLEFIDMEHTPKNILLRATKGTSQQKMTQAVRRYRQFKELLTITPSLEKRFPWILSEGEKT